MVFSLLELAELFFPLAEGCLELLFCFIDPPHEKKVTTAELCWWDILVVVGSLLTVMAIFAILCST